MKVAISLTLLLVAPNQVNAFAPVPNRHAMPHGGQQKSATSIVAKLDNGAEENGDELIMRTTKNPQSVVVTAINDLFEGTNSAQKAAMAVALMLTTMAPLPSNAAMSGGRMGGGGYSSSSVRTMSPSRSSYSRSPMSRGGYSSGYAAGLGTGYLTAPRVNYYGGGFSPFVPRPYYGGYGGGAGIISYNSGPNFGQLLLFGGLAYFASQALKTQDSDVAGWDSSTSALGSGTSVVKMSVALEVPNRDDKGSILSVLDKLGQTANTSNQRGIQSLTSQVALEVLRRKSSIISAATEYKRFGTRSQASREFNNQAIRERSKFENENIGAASSQKTADASSTKATVAVVTLVLSIDGDSTKVPEINSIADVETALGMISADAKADDCLQSVEILWTPQDRSEVLSVKDVISDYPTLRRV